jgi:hypothetical protein
MLDAHRQFLRENLHPDHHGLWAVDLRPQGSAGRAAAVQLQSGRCNSTVSRNWGIEVQSTYHLDDSRQVEGGASAGNPGRQ